VQKLVYLAQRRKAGKVVDKLPSADLTIDPSDDGVPGANGVPGAKGRMCKPVIEARKSVMQPGRAYHLGLLVIAGVLMGLFNPPTRLAANQPPPPPPMCDPTMIGGESFTTKFETVMGECFDQKPPLSPKAAATRRRLCCYVIQLSRKLCGTNATQTVRSIKRTNPQTTPQIVQSTI